MTTKKPNIERQHPDPRPPRQGEFRQDHGRDPGLITNQMPKESNPPPAPPSDKK